MTEPPYPFLVSNNALDYSFESVSDSKIVNKAIAFQMFPGNPIFYNMALVDVDDTGKINDLAISNNQDMARVLATVLNALLTFFGKYPNKLVHFKGSDEEGFRIRLYRIVIARELSKANELSEIYGQLSTGSYEYFQPNRPYIAFIFQLRQKP